MQLYSFLLVNSPLIEEQQPRMGIFSPSSLCRQFYVFRRLNPFDSPINVKCSTTIDEVSHWSIVDDGSIWRPSQMSLWRRTGLNNVGTWKARLVPHFPSFKGGGIKIKVGGSHPTVPLPSLPNLLVAWQRQKAHTPTRRDGKLCETERANRERQQLFLLLGNKNFG